MHLDEVTIAAGLLHDVVEDTEIDIGDIEVRFGADVAELVDGVTKLDKLEFSSKEAAQAENFQKFILAMTSDIRVLLVKLATSLIGISSIHLLKTFINAEHLADRIILWQVAIHLSFLISALAIAWTDRIMTTTLQASKSAH